MRFMRGRLLRTAWGWYRSHEGALGRSTKGPTLNAGQDFQTPHRPSEPLVHGRTTRSHLSPTGSVLIRIVALCGMCALIVAAAAPALADGCSLGVGWHVVLASEAVDPDVFVWDSRTRLIDYAAGRWSDTQAIFAHTTLAQSGTEAVVISCAAGAARPKHTSSEQDIVGVKITRGPFRGRYGWVLATDAHPAREARTSKT